MANIALRNPQYKNIQVPSSGVLSSQCQILISTNSAQPTLRYTLVKNVVPNQSVSFDISELSRDFLEITYASNNSSADTISIKTQLKNFSALNAGGSQVGSTVESNDIGFEAYGLYIEGSNPEVPFGRTKPTFLLASETQRTAETDTFTVYFPENVAGVVPTMLANGTTSTSSFSATATTFNDAAKGVLLNIKRIGCTKYGTGQQVVFINKYGVQQDLWFFLKKTNTISRTNENYKANTLIYEANEPATYEFSNAPVKIFNTQGKKSITLNSGYYPETAVPYFEQLLLSEFVWMRLKRIETGTFSTIPFIVKSSSIIEKTSVNDRLIEYTIDFELAADYINNIR